MKRAELLRDLSAAIKRVARRPLRVAVDGVDCAGKTWLANELAAYLGPDCCVIRASIDGFHRPRSERYRRGPTSPQGYYFDSFDYTQLKEQLLEPLAQGGRILYRTAVFDYRSDRPIDQPPLRASPDAILVFDGVFLLRPELRLSWDLSVFVHIGFAEALNRAQARDATEMAGVQAVAARYRTRYIPGQQLYLSEAKPHLVADIVVDNTDPTAPVIVHASADRRKLLQEDLAFSRQEL